MEHLKEVSRERSVELRSKSAHLVKVRTRAKLRRLKTQLDESIRVVLKANEAFEKTSKKADLLSEAQATLKVVQERLRAHVRSIATIEQDVATPQEITAAVDASAHRSPDELDAALGEASARGARLAAKILDGPDMLSSADFAKLIRVSSEAVRLKRDKHEILGLEGAKRGIRFPEWQITSNGGVLPELPRVFDLLGGNAWTVYRFLVQRHPELKGATAANALKAGHVAEVLVAAENAGQDFS